jgi:hypothetical protein
MSPRVLFQIKNHTLDFKEKVFNKEITIITTIETESLPVLFKYASVPFVITVISKNVKIKIALTPPY